MALFEFLTREGRRAPAPLANPPSAIPEARIRAATLAEWASASACTETFLPYLDSLIALADFEESENLLSHPAMAFARGKREALLAFRKDFQSWRDKA